VNVFDHGPAGEPVVSDIEILGIHGKTDTVIFAVKKFGKLKDKIIRAFPFEIGKIKIE